MSRTRTFVSTARTPLPDVARDAFLQLRCAARLRRPLGKERPVHVLERVAPRPPNDDGAVLVVPLEDGAWTNAEPSSDLRWDGYLALSCHLGMRDGRHTSEVTRSKGGRQSVGLETLLRGG